MLSEIKNFNVEVRVDYGEQLDCKHYGYCKSCGREIFDGDTIYDPHNDSPCCVYCYYVGGIANRELKTAGA